MARIAEDGHITNTVTMKANDKGQIVETADAPEAAPDEAPAAAAEPAPAETPDAERFAALARQEKALREERLRFKEEAAGIEALKGDLTSWKEAQELFKTNPTKALQLLGEKTGVDDPYSYITEAVINDGNLSSDQKQRLRDEQISALQEEIQNLKTEREQGVAQTAESKFRDHIGGYLAENTEDLPLVSGLQGKDYVYTILEQDFQKSSDPDNWDAYAALPAAAKAVEAQYEKEIADIATKISAVPKAKEILLSLLKTSDSPPEEEQQTSARLEATTRPTTLTNRATAETTPRGKHRFLTEDESIRAAAELIKFT